MKCTLTIREILGSRFGIPAGQIRRSDIKTLMSYCTFRDLQRLCEEDMEAFLAEGKKRGLFTPSRQ